MRERERDSTVAIVFDMTFVKAINRHLFRALLGHIEQLRLTGHPVYLQNIPPEIALLMSDYLLERAKITPLHILDDSVDPPRVVVLGDEDAKAQPCGS